VAHYRAVVPKWTTLSFGLLKTRVQNRHRSESDARLHELLLSRKVGPRDPRLQLNFIDHKGLHVQAMALDCRTVLGPRVRVESAGNTNLAGQWCPNLACARGFWLLRYCLRHQNGHTAGPPDSPL
jgi:hypothetical protein